MSIGEKKIAEFIDTIFNDEKYTNISQEATMLINTGANLQSMDVYLVTMFELSLGALNDDEIIVGVAEYHRQALEYLNLPIPSRCLAPDPLRLPKVHRMPAFRGPKSIHGGQYYIFTEAEIDELMNALREKRPEIIHAYHVDLQNWINLGCPSGEVYGEHCHTDTAYYALNAFVLDERPDIDTMPASSAFSKLHDRIMLPFRDQINKIKGW